MSNPNMNALASAASNASMRTIHIGKDSHPVTLPNMASVNSYSLRKSTSFNTLENVVYSLLGYHTIADFISLVSDELPLDTGAAFQEAQNAAKLIVDKAVTYYNVEPLAFLTSTAKVVNFDDDITDLAKRSEDITFLRFRCVLDGATLDKRVSHTSPPTFFSFLSKTPAVSI